MREHHAATTSGVAPSRLLSLTHFLIQAASSASASAGVIDEAKPRPMTPRHITTAKETIPAFIGFFLSGRSIGLNGPRLYKKNDSFLPQLKYAYVSLVSRPLALWHAQGLRAAEGDGVLFPFTMSTGLMS